MATIKHAKTDLIADWTQADLDQQIAAGNYPPGTLLADIVLPSDWNNDHTLTGTVAIANGGTGATTLAGASIVTYTGTETLTNKTLTSPKVNLINDTNGNEILGFSPTTSATDYLVVKNGIGVGVPLHIYADGSSTNTGMHIQPKGTGLVTISDGTDFNKGIRFRSSSSAASAITLLDAVSTAGRVVTLPDATTTLVGRDTTDTLTNKSISGSTNTLSNIANASLTNSSITINGTAVSLGGTVTTPSGTVTSVGGTGTVSGISLSGTVTSSGNLTLGGTLDLSSPPTIGNTTANTGAFTSVTTPSVTATTDNLTLSAISTGAVKLSTAGGTQFQVNNTASATAWGQITGSTVSSFAGAIEFSSASTVSGSDAISINYATQQIGNHAFKTGVSKLTQLNITGVASVVNYHNFVGSATTKAPIYSVAGSDTNISMAFQPKGTGAIDLAAGSSGVNISNGGTVTAITRTNSGTSYTSAPTWTASAPTTAGGVTATGTTTLSMQATPTITSGGTGYTVGDVLTLVGGTFLSGTAAVQLTVTTVSAGVITGVTVSYAGNLYTAVPTNPISVTGGSGTGATFTSTTQWGIQGSLIIGNAGSGYIEQPTITFSGGGGSGAAAYATVGSATTLRHIGGFHSFTGPSGISFAINSASGTVTNYVQASSQSTGNYPNIAAAGTDAAVGLDIFSKGATPVRTRTGTGGATQFQVSDTASAVNYVQVTGGVTSGQPVVSAQGSDGNIGLNIRSKGTFNINLQNGAGNSGLVVNMTSGTTLANYVEVAPKVAGTSPVISALGTDTDIDLALTPKGAGRVRFGTYTGTILTPTGFIEIKDSGGTTRRLLVG